MDEMKKITGGCLCGAVRYETTAAPLWTFYCHCESCRRHSGAPVVMFVGFPIDEVHWPGDERDLYETSPGVFRGFCRKCGSSITYERVSGGKEMFEVHIGTLDAPDDFPPKKHWYHNERISWFDTTDHEVRLDADGKPYRYDPAV